MRGSLHTTRRKLATTGVGLLAAFGLFAVAVVATGNWRWVNRHTHSLDLASGRIRHTQTVFGLITVADEVSDTWVSRLAPEPSGQPHWVVTAELAPPFRNQSFNSPIARTPSLIVAVETYIAMTPLTDAARSYVAGQVIRRWQAGDPPTEYLTDLLDSLARGQPSAGQTIDIDQFDPLTDLPQAAQGN